MEKGKRRGEITAYGVIALGAVLMALNYQLFVVENGFAPAGLNGIATMIQYKTGFSIGYLSLIINVPLCVLAYLFLNRSFAQRSLAFSLVYSFAFLLFQNLGLENLQYRSDGSDTIFPVILSGVIGGFVYGICFRVNASTGGTDIVSKYISRKKPEWNFFWVTFALNAAVAAVSLFVYAKPDGSGALTYDYDPVCFCILYCFISSFVGNVILRGTKSANKFTIITTHAAQIQQEIHDVLHHTSTQIASVGSFSHNQMTVLICVINKHQVYDLEKILSKYGDTFAFSETVNATYGNFKQVK